ncbi:hypothetical protein B0J14DRAFT_492769, partial [Halenospora varia]
SQTCGPHVHVGYGTKGVDGCQLKKLMASVWTFKPQLAQIHPPHRAQNNFRCESLRFYS